jgi:AcrR family transcriptional regulator
VNKVKGMNVKETGHKTLALPCTPKGIQTRASILEAARTVFGRDGYVAMRVGDVATEAGLSLGSLYRYFLNKEDLFACLIADIHERLFDASRAVHTDFQSAPYEALLESNHGYLQCYFENRDIMRALFEAVTVEEKYRNIWWGMRTRHIARFVHALKHAHGISDVDGVDIGVIVDAMASMVEQSAYCWFAQENLNEAPVSLETAAKAVTIIWYRAFFKA